MTHPSLPDDLTLYVDPGEDTGWAISRGDVLLGACTTKMWEFSDDVWVALEQQHNNRKRGYTPITDPEHPWILSGCQEHLFDDGGNLRKITRIVCEDWRLYPSTLRELAWDQCRTARLIGSLTQASRWYKLEMVLQPASIKADAEMAGAKNLYYRPLHENRHQNDAIQHFVFYRMNQKYSGKMRERLKAMGLDNISNKGDSE